MMAVGRVSPHSTCGESASLSAAAHFFDDIHTESLRPLIALNTRFNILQPSHSVQGRMYIHAYSGHLKSHFIRYLAGVHQGNIIGNGIVKSTL